MRAEIWIDNDLLSTMSLDVALRCGDHVVVSTMHSVPFGGVPIMERLIVDSVEYYLGTHSIAMVQCTKDPGADLSHEEAEPVLTMPDGSDPILKALRQAIRVMRDGGHFAGLSETDAMAHLIECAREDGM